VWLRIYDTEKAKMNPFSERRDPSNERRDLFSERGNMSGNKSQIFAIKFNRVKIKRYGEFIKIPAVGSFFQADLTFFYHNNPVFVE
jgi:hypothetical protein